MVGGLTTGDHRQKRSVGRLGVGPVLEVTEVGLWKVRIVEVTEDHGNTLSGPRERTVSSGDVGHGSELRSEKRKDKGVSFTSEVGLFGRDSDGAGA